MALERESGTCSNFFSIRFSARENAESYCVSRIVGWRSFGLAANKNVVSRRAKMNLRSSSILPITILCALCGILYFPYLGSTPFFDKGEPREAMAVQDIVRRGEWLVPLKRATDIPSKPPLFHWSAALTARITGELSEATIRFPSALYATLGVLILYVFGRKLFGVETGFLGAAILATTMIYANQALSARVDMTLSFFVTLSLVLFYSIYRGLLSARVWTYVFYAVLGLGTLAKGPLGLLLPALVAGTFLIVRKRWDVIFKFCFHPGVILTVLLAAGWYVIAVTRGGEGFIDRQLLQENFERFFGGSGHSHPIYYYIPYLFSQGLPWSLFFPFLIWDGINKRRLADEDTLFLVLWVAVMFVFFSVSAGKRPVYLLPLYPAFSLLLGAWFYGQVETRGIKKLLYRFVALVAGVMGVVLLIIIAGDLWNHDHGWFFDPIGALLKAKDRANLLVVKDALGMFGWSFTLVTLLSATLWFSLARCLWLGELRSAAWRLVLIAVPFAFVSRSLVLPVIAEGKSYRPFMEQVSQQVKAGDRLYLYGDSFNSDSVVFYWGTPIEMFQGAPAKMHDGAGPSHEYVIMTEKDWAEIHSSNPDFPQPLLTSKGTGPEGDSRLLLIRS